MIKKKWNYNRKNVKNNKEIKNENYNIKSENVVSELEK